VRLCLFTYAHREAAYLCDGVLSENEKIKSEKDELCFHFDSSRGCQCFANVVDLKEKKYLLSLSLNFDMNEFEMNMLHFISLLLIHDQLLPMLIVY